MTTMNLGASGATVLQQQPSTTTQASAHHGITLPGTFKSMLHPNTMGDLCIQLPMGVHHFQDLMERQQQTPAPKQVEHQSEELENSQSQEDGNNNTNHQEGEDEHVYGRVLTQSATMAVKTRDTEPARVQLTYRTMVAAPGAGGPVNGPSGYPGAGLAEQGVPGMMASPATNPTSGTNAAAPRRQTISCHAKLNIQTTLKQTMIPGQPDEKNLIKQYEMMLVQDDYEPGQSYFSVAFSKTLVQQEDGGMPHHHQHQQQQQQQNSVHGGASWNAGGYQIQQQTEKGLMLSGHYTCLRPYDVGTVRVHLPYSFIAGSEGGLPAGVGTSSVTNIPMPVAQSSNVAGEKMMGRPHASTISSPHHALQQHQMPQLHLTPKMQHRRPSAPPATPTSLSSSQSSLSERWSHIPPPHSIAEEYIGEDGNVNTETNMTAGPGSSSPMSLNPSAPGFQPQFGGHGAGYPQQHQQHHQGYHHQPHHHHHHHGGNTVPQQSPHRLRFCYGCGESGHLHKDCPKDQLFCYNCNQTGHSSKNCKKPKPWEQQQQQLLMMNSSLQQQGVMMPPPSMNSAAPPNQPPYPGMMMPLPPHQHSNNPGMNMYSQPQRHTISAGSIPQPQMGGNHLLGVKSGANLTGMSTPPPMPFNGNPMETPDMMAFAAMHAKMTGGEETWDFSALGESLGAAIQSAGGAHINQHLKPGMVHKRSHSMTAGQAPIAANNPWTPPATSTTPVMGSSPGPVGSPLTQMQSPSNEFSFLGTGLNAVLGGGNNAGLSSSPDKNKAGVSRCFLCGSFGHVAKACQNGRKCFNCDSFGHSSYECVLPKRERSSSLVQGSFSLEDLEDLDATEEVGQDLDVQATTAVRN